MQLASSVGGAQCVLDVDRDWAGGDERHPLVGGRDDFDVEFQRASRQPATNAALAAAAGTAVLGLTSITSIVNRHDLGLFNVLAPLTNAGGLFGSIILAVSLKRAGTVPLAVAFGLPIAWVATIPLATVGGGVIAGAYYAAVGRLLLNRSAGHTPSAAAQPANAWRPEGHRSPTRPAPAMARAARRVTPIEL